MVNHQKSAIDELRETGFDLTGRRFGRLLVEGFDHYGEGQSYWRCRCDCGGEKTVGRKMLQKGSTKSCGCLRGKHGGGGFRKRKVLSEEEAVSFKREFPYTTNEVLAQRYDMSQTSVHRFARQYGLNKSKEFMVDSQLKGARAAELYHMAHGTYPKKGYKIPRSEEHSINDYRLKETQEMKAARLEKARASRNRAIEEERRRILFGLPQRTRMKLIKQPRGLCALRYALRKHGYIVDRGGHIAYYTPDTVRMPKVEARKPGDKHYYWMEFKPFNESL
ncbi:MAG: hypothetical protein IJL91_05550 [Bacteroidales bacterium]|nr:hypothetical protein [Bacteroidales bacterium]